MNLSKEYFKKLSMVLLFIMVGSVSRLDAANAINIEASGNLEVKHALACISLAEVKSSYSPADLFYGISQCLDNHEYEKATKLFSVALAYGRYDQLRVTDKSAHQAITVLRLQLMNAKQEHIDTFQNVLNEQLKEKERWCADLKDLPSPTYFPRYMIQHGIDAFSKSEGAHNGLNAQFNSEEAWRAVKKNYLMCE